MSSVNSPFKIIDNTEYLYIVISPAPPQSITNGQQMGTYIKIGDQDGWDSAFRRYKTDNPSFFFRSIVVERDKATTSVDLFGQGPGKAVEWQLFKTQNPISGYNAVDGTEWHGTVGRAQQVATIAHNWDATTWAVNGPAVQLGDIKIGQNGSLGKNDVAKPVQNRGVQGDTVGGQFNSRMAVYEWLKSLL